MYKPNPNIIGEVGTGSINQIRRPKDIGRVGRIGRLKRSKRNKQSNILKKVGALK